MIESILALLLLTVCFFTLFQFADNLRAKLLCEYAAGRCARARTIGLNDYMVEKTAHIATMSAAGECFSRTSSGTVPGVHWRIARSPDYLQCEYTAQAREVLDFDYWRDRTSATCTLAGPKIVATVTQRRPQFFDLAAWLDGRATEADEDGNTDAYITGTAEIEAHYPDWLK